MEQFSYFLANEKLISVDCIIMTEFLFFSTLKPAQMSNNIISIHSNDFSVKNV